MKSSQSYFRWVEDIIQNISEKEYRSEKWGRVIQPVTNVSLQINPPPIPDLDGIITAPYGNCDNFRLAILVLKIPLTLTSAFVPFPALGTCIFWNKIMDNYNESQTHLLYHILYYYTPYMLVQLSVLVIYLFNYS